MEKLDCSGLACPMPVIKLKKFIAQKDGQSFNVEFKLTDRGGLKDIPAFCNQQGLMCVLKQDDKEIVFEIANGMK